MLIHIRLSADPIIERSVVELLDLPRKGEKTRARELAKLVHLPGRAHACRGRVSFRGGYAQSEPIMGILCSIETCAVKEPHTA